MKFATQAQQKWKEYEARSSGGGTLDGWITSQELPCRLCTDKNNGVEVWKPISSFESSTDTDTLFKRVLQKGQDLVCYRCTRQYLKWSKLFDDVIPCDGCGIIQTSSKYDAANAKIWQTLGDEEIYCKRCLGIKQRGTKTDMIKCNGECQQDLPDYHFVDLMIVEARKTQSTIALKCARCTLKEKNVDEKEKHVCERCGKTKHISEFNPLIAKEWLGARRSNRLNWKCYDCQYPSCVTCNARTLYAVPHNALVDGKYYCMTCRYPPCKKCGASRPDPGSKQRFKEYVCDVCAMKVEEEGSKACSTCTRKQSIQNFGSLGGLRRSDICNECKEKKACSECGVPKHNYEYDRDGERSDICKKCAEEKTCTSCGIAKAMYKFAKDKSRHYSKMCRDCIAGKTASLKACKRCGQHLAPDAFAKKPCRTQYKTCKACQHPPCSECGEPLSKIWSPPPNTQLVPTCESCARRKKSNKRKP